MVTEKQYQKIVKDNSPKSKSFANCLKAFLIGGGICALGQGLTDLYMFLNIKEKDAKTLCSITLIFLGVFFTANCCKHLLLRHCCCFATMFLICNNHFTNSWNPALYYRFHNSLSSSI